MTVSQIAIVILCGFLGGAGGGFVASRMQHLRRQASNPNAHRRRPEPGPPEPPKPPRRAFSSSPYPRIKLRQGDIVLIPSDGGYAPDASDPEMVRVLTVAGNQATVLRVNPEGEAPRFINAEPYADAVRIVNFEKLLDFLDALGKDESHARRKAATPLLRSPEEWLFHQ